MEGHSAINVYTDGGRGILSREGDARFCCGKCFYLLHKRVFVHSVNESIDPTIKQYQKKTNSSVVMTHTFFHGELLSQLAPTFKI